MAIAVSFLAISDSHVCVSLDFCLYLTYIVLIGWVFSLPPPLLVVAASFRFRYTFTSLYTT